MGLRLVAHYYDRSEALIVAAALDAAGVPNFIENHAQLSIQPFSEIALGGYRLMVCRQDLESALSVIHEARRRRSFEGQRLSQRTHTALSMFLLLTTGLFLPFRTSKWHDV